MRVAQSKIHAYTSRHSRAAEGKKGYTPACMFQRIPSAGRNNQAQSYDNLASLESPRKPSIALYKAKKNETRGPIFSNARQNNVTAFFLLALGVA